MSTLSSKLDVAVAVAAADAAVVCGCEAEIDLAKKERNEPKLFSC